MTLPAPTTVWPPSTVALAYSVEPSSTVGWRFLPRMICPLASRGNDSAPKVTPWYSLTPSPMCGGLADHDAGGVIDEERRADGRAGMNVGSRSWNAPTRS